MSTNITSTPNTVPAGVPASEFAGGVGNKPEGWLGLGWLPDPALMAKLANEYFAALPADPAPAADVLLLPPAATGAGAEPAPAPTTAMPIANLPPGVRGAAGYLPENPGAVPAQGAPASPVNSLSGARTGPLDTEPSFPADLFVLPGVPDALAPQGAPALPSALPADAASRGMPAVPDGATLSPAGDPGDFRSLGTPETLEAVGGEGKSPSSDTRLSIPVATNLFAFPGVPGVRETPSLPSLPSLPPGSLLTEADLRALPGLLADAGGTVANVPAGAPAPPVSSELAPYLGENAGSPMNAAPLFPLTSDLFSLPGVPGLQSPPGTPVVPTSPPAAPPAGGDPGAQFVPVPGAGAGAWEAPGISSSPAAPADATIAGAEAPVFHPEMVPEVGISQHPFDPHFLRRDFPILQEKVHGRPLIWLDNAATTQKPNAVIDRVSEFYRHENSNVHRAAHTLAARATDAYESAREKVRRFLNASSAREIVFVRGTTEGINLVAKSWGHRYVEKDDEVVITWLEHHANIVPWQQLCAEKGARLRVAPVDDRGQVILEQYEKLLGPRTRLVAFSHVSNALGTITPAREMIEMAHRHGAHVLLDGAQSVAHMREDVQALDCDFFVFSGHKIFGPTGIGVVYGKEGILAHTPPWQGGGSMILDVTFEKTVYNIPPARFEAGTGNIAGAVGLGAALDYLSEIGLENVARHEHALLTYATAGLARVPGLRIIGTAAEKAGVISFVLDEIRNEDVGVALNQEGIAVRAGHHCAQPILRRFGVEGTVRPSLALYNTTEDIDALVAALLRIQAERALRKQP